MDKKSLYKEVLDLKAKNYSYVEISRRTGVNRTTVMDWCKGKTDPKKLKGLSRAYSVSDEDFIKFVEDSFSVSQVLKKCKVEPRGGNYRVFYKRKKELGLDTSHFTGQAHLKGKKNKYTPEFSVEEAFVKGGSLCTSHLKRKILKYNLLEYKCSCCDIIDEWNNQPISLHLDHINGINDDNRLKNLRFLCPNCHSQTKTYCRKKSSIC